MNFKNLEKNEKYNILKMVKNAPLAKFQLFGVFQVEQTSL